MRGFLGPHATKFRNTGGRLFGAAFPGGCTQQLANFFPGPAQRNGVRQFVEGRVRQRSHFGRVGIAELRIRGGEQPH